MRPKLLVVDDDPNILELIELMIETCSQCDWELITANSGEGARKAIKENNLSFILLDIFLPDINGCNLCKQIKDDPATSHIPIYFFSASSPHRADYKKEYNADGFIGKPFRNDEFINCLRSILNPN